MPPDVDTQQVMTLLADAVADSGLTQAQFAAALGTSASRFSTYRCGQTKPSAAFCFRARRIGGALRAARRWGLMSAPATAAAVRDADDESWAWRMLLQGRDHLRLMLDRADGTAAAWEAAPPCTGSEGFDALLVALVRREFDRASVDPPAWSSALKRLPEPWVLEHPFLERERVIALTPDFLRDINVFVPARDLVTA